MVVHASFLESVRDDIAWLDSELARINVGIDNNLDALARDHWINDTLVSANHTLYRERDALQELRTEAKARLAARQAVAYYCH